MPYYFQRDGHEVKCDTLEELDAAVGKRGPRPAKAERRAGKGDGRSAGVSKGWAIAQWYALHHNTTPNDARPLMKKMRLQQKAKWVALTEEFEKFAAWYESKSGQKPGADVLRKLYSDDQEAYKKAVDEYKRPSKGGK